MMMQRRPAASMLLALAAAAVASAQTPPPAINQEYTADVQIVQAQGSTSQTLSASAALSQSKNLFKLTETFGSPDQPDRKACVISDYQKGTMHQVTPFFTEHICYLMPLSGTQTSYAVATGYFTGALFYRPDSLSFSGNKTLPDGRPVEEFSVSTVVPNTTTTEDLKVSFAPGTNNLLAWSIRVTNTTTKEILQTAQMTNNNYVSHASSPWPAGSFDIPAGTTLPCVSIGMNSSAGVSYQDAPAFIGDPKHSNFMKLRREFYLRRGEQSDAAEMRRSVNDRDAIASINTAAKGLWTAGSHDGWEGKTLEDLQTLMGTAMLSSRLPPSPKRFTSSGNARSIPDAYDVRDAFGKMCPSVGLARNQGRCGSCWAFSAAETLTDRMCIASQGSADQDQPLSPEDLLSCDKGNNGCSGGMLDEAWWHLKSTGIPTDKCVPYQHCANPAVINCSLPLRAGTSVRINEDAAQLSGSGSDDVCPSTCADGSAIVMRKAASAYAVATPGNQDDIKREILENGPIQVAFFVFGDFMSYKGGVYTHTGKSPMMGGHAVKMVGWGVDAGVPYWTIANSWSPAWGENGFFRIRRGTNECGIETTPAAGLPAV